MDFVPKALQEYFGMNNKVNMHCVRVDDKSIYYGMGVTKCFF